MARDRQVVARLLDTAGTTYAEDAGITLRDKPMPLFKLLSLCMLASKPISADTAVAAARELFRAGIRTPSAVLEADRGDLIAAFGRAGYARYDESSATRMARIANRVNDEYGGNLRNLRVRAHHDVAAAREALQGFDGIGHTGADIFLREIQDVWTWAQPYFDERALSTAKALGLPTDARKLGDLAPKHNARLAAALVRASLDDTLRRRIED
ncbi:HhH-GDP family DNA glycosylase [Mycolicibacterium aubagnense]|uniref:Endonuclease n=1 Tax=Mycolicibacterium aubagnense TaxID=319707 RepID=A0ABN5YMJ9_9MYCO|nr:endonuclease [Mycolicibacterium aubagnense]TLH61798.1 endonuclease [Mycolicibacterium aubagnense]WGI35223.1 endonuclease [Mycolicibacterium aubagnense]BBX82823.1 endonuclease [Mycolicibacterium aubagnense]